MNRFDESMRQLNNPSGRLRPASEAEILLLEEEIGHRLPEDYRDFLGTYGGCFIGSGFLIPTDTKNDETIAFVGVMFGILPYDTCDIFHTFHMKRPYLPPELLTIASGDNGEICLAVYGDKRGSVYFHNTREGGDDYESMYWLTDSFEQFIYDLAFPPGINEW